MARTTEIERSIQPRLDRIEGMLRHNAARQRLLIRMGIIIMIDTSKALAEVARERTASASLRALVAANTAAVADLSTQLAAAIAAMDPAALAQVQADLDQIVADLSLDNDASEAALAANVPPTTP